MNRQKHFPKNPWKIEALQFLCWTDEFFGLSRLALVTVKSGSYCILFLNINFIWCLLPNEVNSVLHIHTCSAHRGWGKETRMHVLNVRWMKALAYVWCMHRIYTYITGTVYLSKAGDVAVAQCTSQLYKINSTLIYYNTNNLFATNYNVEKKQEQRSKVRDSKWEDEGAW